MTYRNTACPRCGGLLGTLTTPVDQATGAHTEELCAKLRATDWAALRPYFTGNLSGVQMGSA